MRIKLAIAICVMALTVGFVQVGTANAVMITADWTGCSTATFSLHLDDVTGAQPSPLEYYAVTGKLNWFLQYPITGTAVFDSGHNVYRLSLFTTSATGETFTFGFEIDPATMTGTGNEQRIAHGSVNADCPGTLSNAVITE